MRAGSVLPAREAHLLKREYPAAIRQYESLLANRGVDPFSPVVPLASLGIARARARSGDGDGAKRAFDHLFRLWKSADADFPPLLAARAEYAALK